MSSVKVKRYVLLLSDEDEVHVVLRIRDGRLVGFSMNLRTLVQGAWKEAVRYDTAHGRLHVHRFSRAGRHTVRMLEGHRPARPDYAQAFQQARADLLQNWLHHRQAVREGPG